MEKEKMADASLEYSTCSYPNAQDMQFACEMHFEAGAEWMCKQLTRWNDPNDPPTDVRKVLIKIEEGLVNSGYYDSSYKGFFIGYDFYYPNEILGWREIHE